MTRKSGCDHQHVFTSQLPESPWHLHFRNMLSFRDWKYKKVNKSMSYNQQERTRCFMGTYHSSRLIVVSVHGWASVGTVFPRVSEFPGHHAAEIHIFAAAAPLPPLARWTLVPTIASTNSGRALGAGASHGKGDPRWGDGVHECWLSSGWNKKFRTM